jgi:hypothetical protein
MLSFNKMSYWNPEHIGVTTSATSLYQRSNFDIKMAKEFNPVYVKCGPPKAHQYEAFRISDSGHSGTSQHGSGTLDEFRISDSGHSGTSQHGSGTVDGFAYRSNFDKKYMLDKFNPLYSSNQMVHEAYQPRHRQIYDDPYNKFSYLTLQPDMI